MLIGLDFDNTIAGYDHVFPAVAERQGMIAKGHAKTKIEVRDLLRRQPDGETTWMALQGRVYGAHMNEAQLVDGVAKFLERCRDRRITVCIVSHKTKTGHFDPDNIDLREAARAWMDSLAFFDADGFGLDPNTVYFETTRAEKVARIAALKCTHFIDDLEEVFLEPKFPDTVDRYLLAINRTPLPTGPFKAMPDWKSIAHSIFNPTS